MRTAIRLADEAVVLHEDDSGIEFESALRLAPGRWVTLAPGSSGERRAFVWSWHLVEVGSAGPRYRGRCLWDQPSRGRYYPRPIDSVETP